MEIVFTTTAVRSTQENWVLSLYSPVEPELCPGELLTMPRSGGVLLLRAIRKQYNPSVSDFTSTADVMPLSKQSGGL